MLFNPQKSFQENQSSLDKFMLNKRRETLGSLFESFFLKKNPQNNNKPTQLYIYKQLSGLLQKEARTLEMSLADLQSLLPFFRNSAFQRLVFSPRFSGFTQPCTEFEPLNIFMEEQSRSELIPEQISACQASGTNCCSGISSLIPKVYVPSFSCYQLVDIPFLCCCARLMTFCYEFIVKWTSVTCK